MGYAVLHLDKAKGADSGMSAHIERTIHPKNADPSRTHLNRELIQFPEGVTSRTQAILHRLDTAVNKDPSIPQYTTGSDIHDRQPLFGRRL